jgi:hypothetical protein
MKDNQEETISNYDGNARPGEIVVNLNNNDIYIGDTNGNLQLINTGGGSGNSEPAGAVGAIQLNAGGNLFGASANLSFANNTFTTANVIPVADNTYFLGDETHRWANLWLGPGTIYITDSANTANTAEITVNDGILEVNGATGLQANLISGNTTLTLAENGNINLSVAGNANVWTFGDDGTLTFPNDPNNHTYYPVGDPITFIQGGYDPAIVSRFSNGALTDYAAWTDYFNFKSDSGNSVIIHAASSEIIGDTQLTLTTNFSANDPADYKHLVFDNTGAVTFPGSQIRTSIDGVVLDIVPGTGQIIAEANSPKIIYLTTDDSVIATDLTVIIQYDGNNDTYTEITKLLVTKDSNIANQPNLVVTGQSLTTNSIAPGSYTAGRYPGTSRIYVEVTTAPSAGNSYVTVKATEFGVYYSA